MKRKGQHPEKALSALRIKSAKTPGRYADGNGLYLVVAPTGAKRWVLRLVVQGRRRDLGLGSARLVSLVEAREAALAARKLARAGSDPAAVSKDDKPPAPSPLRPPCARSMLRMRQPGRMPRTERNGSIRCAIMSFH